MTFFLVTRRNMVTNVNIFARQEFFIFAAQGVADAKKKIIGTIIADLSRKGYLSNKRKY